jgi:hypothetical protein
MKMKTFKVQRHDRERGIGTDLTLVIKGVDLIDAIKNYFPEILKVASYEYVPFTYPITVTPSFVSTAPEWARKFKDDGNGGQREFTAEEYEADRGYVKLELEWMYSSYLNRDPWLHRYEVTIYAKESDLTSTEAFVILGN